MLAERSGPNLVLDSQSLKEAKATVYTELSVLAYDWFIQPFVHQIHTKWALYVTFPQPASPSLVFHPLPSQSYYF